MHYPFLRSAPPAVNPGGGRGVSIVGAKMHALDASLTRSAVEPVRDTSADLAREFEACIGDGSTLAFRIAMGVLHNRADAEDVAQEALLRAYKNFGRLRDPARFRAWLARIAFRIALDRWRSAGRRERRETAWAAPTPQPTVEDLAASSEFQRHLERAMDDLPPRLRMVLVLAAVEGHDHHEVAVRMGLAEGTVKSRLFQARKRLAEKLQWLVNETRKT